MIFVSGDPYTRMVTFLKVILPLIALGLLSTMFLFSSRIEPGSSIPFADREITERIRDQQVTAPIFSGVTQSDDRVSFKASNMATGNGENSSAQDLSAQIDFATGGSIVMVATQGEFDLDNNQATLTGNVLIESSTQYLMRTDKLIAQLNVIDIISPGDVTATGPAGNLTAGKMRIHAKQPDQSVQLLFTDGVKLVYDPKVSQ